MHIPDAVTPWTRMEARNTLRSTQRSFVPEKPGARIRSFVAIDVTAPVRAGLAGMQAELARTPADVRWVRSGGIHVTLKFLGPVEAELLSRVHTAVAAALTDQVALRIAIRGLGAFPSWRRPRVLWVGMHGSGLVELAGRVDDAVAALGFAREQRAFTPHLTLGRVNSMRGWASLEPQLKTHLEDDFGDSAVDAVTIYRSTLLRGGAVYDALWTIPLRQHKEGTTHDHGR